MDYVEPLFRPPSEADSLLLQITVGCSHNRCTFCGMYRMKKFRVKPLDVVFADIDEAAVSGIAWRRVFLMDGDALILKTTHLLKILERIRQRLPTVERVGIYGDARCVKNKTVDELKELHDAGLGIVYHGIESGNDEVLRRLQKGSTAQEALEAGLKIKESGMLYSAIVLLGAGGVELSHKHAVDTARHLSKVEPHFIGALMLTLVPGTPLYEQSLRGEFVLPDKWGLLEELAIMLENLSVRSPCKFRANHASNYLPIKAELPEERNAALKLVKYVLETRDDSMLKPEWLRGL